MQPLPQPKYLYPVGLIVVLLAVVSYKFRFLGLPYFWDEAWPYGVAVRTLHHHGLSLLPDALPSFVSRGHPLMFHFLAALWMKVFGTSLISGHSFALAVSLLTIVFVYKFCKAFFSKRVAMIACILMAVQPVFIAQSVFLMPEMLMALWTMVCFYYYFRQQWLAFVLAATAMLLTKESGGILILALGATELTGYCLPGGRRFMPFARRAGIIALPVAFAFVYFLIQKLQYGFFLYPFYMNYMASQWMKITSDLPSALAYLFVYDGRNGISAFILVALSMLAFTKRKTAIGNTGRIFLCFVIFIAGYVLFSAVNYYIPRYLLCCFPVFIVLAAALMERALGQWRIILWLSVAGLVVTHLFYYMQPKKIGDTDYSYAVRKDLAVVQYCEAQHLHDAHILANSVLRIDFQEPYAGYLTGSSFTHIESGFSDSTAWCINSSEEDETDLYSQLKSTHKLELVKRIEIGNAWSEVYKVVR